MKFQIHVVWQLALRDILAFSYLIFSIEVFPYFFIHFFLKLIRFYEIVLYAIHKLIIFPSYLFVFPFPKSPIASRPIHDFLNRISVITNKFHFHQKNLILLFYFSICFRLLEFIRCRFRFVKDVCDPFSLGKLVKRWVTFFVNIFNPFLMGFVVLVLHFIPKFILAYVSRCKQIFLHIIFINTLDNQVESFIEQYINNSKKFPSSMNYKNQSANIQSPVFHSPPSQWKFKVKLSNCQIWQNLYDHTIAEAYLLPASYLQNQEKNYIQRKGQGIVNCVGFLYLNQNRNCEGDAYVLVQRITNRLSNVNILTQTQSLKVLYSVYKTLEEVEGVWDEFWLKQNCICFNTEGDVKIWKNPDLWNNYPEKTLLRGGKCKQKTEQMIRRIFRIVEEKCMNPKILEPFRFLSNQNITLQDAYYTASKIAQKLFIDIGVRDNIRLEHNNNNSHYKSKIQLTPHRNSSDYEQKRIPSQQSGRQQRLNFAQTSPSSNSFKRGKNKQIYPQMAAERKTISSHNSPIKYNNNGYVPRSRGYSDYDPIRIQDSNWQKYFQAQTKKYESSPTSPKKQAFKKKYTLENECRNNEAFEQSINNFIVRGQPTIQKMEGDFQTFGILQESKQDSRYCEQENPQPSIKKKSLFDVAEMEEQLIKFNEKKQKVHEKKNRSSLEHVTDDCNPVKNVKFTSTTSAFFQTNARTTEKQLENQDIKTQRREKKKNAGSFYLSPTLSSKDNLENGACNLNRSQKKTQIKKNLPMYMKHMRYVSDVSNSSEKDKSYLKENRQRIKASERSSIPVKNKPQKQNVIY